MQKCHKLVKTLEKGIKPKTPTSDEEEVKEMMENDEQYIIISHQTKEMNVAWSTMPEEVKSG